MPQRHVRDVAGPHLVGPRDRQIPQQIRVNLVSGGRPRGAPLRINRLQAHDPHQPLHALAIDAQLRRQLAAAVKRRSQILLVDPPHQRQVLRRLAGRLVVTRAARQAEQLALPGDAQACRCLVSMHRRLRLSRARQIFFSTTRPPSSGGRSARNSSCSLAGGLVAPLRGRPRTGRPPVPAAASSRPSPGWYARSNSLANCAVVLSPRTAAKATLALNAGPNTRRFRVIRTLL